MSRDNRNINLVDTRNMIYNNLRRQIICGELPQGEKLNEAGMAVQYGINKKHISEVLSKLQLEGLITYVPMKGYYVEGIDRDDLLEIAKIREMLETAIFENFLTKASDEDINETIRLTKRKIAFLRSGLKEEAHKETLASFDYIYAHCSYRRMPELLRQYRDYIDIMIKLAFEQEDDVEKTIHNSELLCEMLEERSIEKCRKWIQIRYNNLLEKIKMAEN